MSAIASIYRSIKGKRLILLGAGIAVVYWIGETAMDVFVFNLGSLPDRLIPGDLNEMWMRLVIVVSVVVFGVYAQTLLEKSRDAETDQQDRKRTVHRR